jgi:transposase
METLEKFIQNNPCPQELKRALAVRMVKQGLSYRQIAEFLAVSIGFISGCCRRYQAQGVEGLKLKYWGTQGYLNPEQKQQIYQWLNQKDYWTIEEVIAYIEDEYGVVYRSRQSYYTLLSEAGFSWKRSAPTHPDKDEEQVAQKKKEIEEILVKYQSEIASGEVRVLFIDECHLLWGEISGYGWSRRNHRVDVEVKSLRSRQTYYGALDYLSKQFFVQEHSAGNGENTVAFFEYLQSFFSESTRLIVFWDGASYHRGQEMKEFLDQVNQGLPSEQWKITCVRLAPNAPEQNPVEDIWLQGKRFIRTFARLCRQFRVVKLLFKLCLHLQTFTFPKAFMYGYCSCSI